ncbi:MAG: NADH-ubiquinone oxidoreductase subunit NDUFA12 family protein [Bdellovibrionales bacterium]
MSAPESFSFIRRLSQIGTLLKTLFFGKEVGHDTFGNRYFLERGKPRPSNGSRVRQKRWVLYKGEPEPSKIPPEWHIWLHYTADAPLSDNVRKPWQTKHEPNKTGTKEAWLPPSMRGEDRPAATGDYQAWKPQG